MSIVCTFRHDQRSALFLILILCPTTLIKHALSSGPWHLLFPLPVCSDLTFGGFFLSLRLQCMSYLLTEAFLSDPMQFSHLLVAVFYFLCSIYCYMRLCSLTSCLLSISPTRIEAPGHNRLQPSGSLLNHSN